MDKTAFCLTVGKKDLYMKKVFSFLAGAFCGALIGGVAALLLTPASGEDLKTGAKDRWQLALDEAQKAREEKQRELEDQFEISRTS